MVTLYKYQHEYLEGLPPKFIFAADTGTGKTLMSLAHYDVWSYPRPLLILAPASKVQTGDWEEEIERWYEGRQKPEYEIYSYEKFSRNPSIKRYHKDGFLGVWRDWLARHPSDFAVIADEVHKGKNPQSGNGKRLFEVATRAKFFVGLSATPMPNGWIDAANYFKIFGYTKGITDFKRRYCRIVDYKGFPEIVEYYRQGELQRLWNNIAKPLSKDAALDLPSVTSIPINLPTGPDYIKVQKDRLFNDKFLDNPAALMHALRQSLIKPKLAWLDEFLEGASGNIVVFYNYVGERERITTLLKQKKFKDRPVFRMDGQKHELPPKSAWEGLSRSITLAQYQSGSQGVEMTYADTIVYFSPTYSYMNYEQSQGRINRNGQTKKMTLYLLRAPSTIERDIWGALKEKRDFQEKQWYEEMLAAAKGKLGVEAGKVLR